jgi:ATP-dependent exoDNAse (exonuclease V) alpha subunit
LMVCPKGGTPRTERQLIGSHRYPSGADNEKLICLHNNYDLDVFNGQPIRLDSVEDEGDPLTFTAEVFADDGRERFVSRGRTRVYKGWFDFTATGMRHKDAKIRALIDLDQMQQTAKSGQVLQLDWSYCITTHKAQGSEWGRVLFITQRYPQIASERVRLHYTAITRARTKLAIIENWETRL